MANVVHVTEEGLDKLKKDLDELKFKKRPELSQKIATARDFGD
ncbi:MAG: transcription elongation factor GreA, partial [Calditrichia bacterium]|nr:transcription elongation factor GreA [Calditrichia bacterium]